MTYVISDLHGYPIEKLKMLLEKASFGENDFLYILGDVIDRNGDGGVGILQWLLTQPNAQLILGNHEAMLLSCEFLFDEITDESVADILDYLHETPLYEAITVGGKDYFLCHSGIDDFEKGKKISDYPADAFIWAWSEISDEYFDDIITVFGHTPTMNYGEQYRNKIIKTRTWIDIDMGAADGKTEPVLLRLDDMKEFRN